MVTIVNYDRSHIYSKSPPGEYFVHSDVFGEFWEKPLRLDICHKKKEKKNGKVREKIDLICFPEREVFKHKISAK